MANRLAFESSPYLLQHKDNPVDWYPWGEDAFERARREDKPIFLSVGYSTCHWCHVMEHESFESPRVADVLNRLFVSVKVDREERPDVDRVYMTFVQATTGSGGWPMSVWLTPDLQPFYGGTYFPPESRWGKPGFIDVLEEIGRVWREEREKVVRWAGDTLERLRTLANGTPSERVPGTDVLSRTAQEFAAAFDARRGGFGGAPKFPRPSELLFLLREYARTGEGPLRDMVLLTLRAMALGGLRDHVGGGFHRYAVDADWRVPHFEKMLYDQAQLVLACLEAAQAAGDLWYAEVARDTLEYVSRDLGDPEGGFYSAEDADSVPPDQANDPHARKTEGAFYLWSDAEIGEALGADADVFRLRFGILPGGNAPFDPEGEFAGRNLLYTARGVDAIAAQTARSADDVAQALARARRLLLERRSRRPRPHLDDKILTAWNGLTIAAYARAGRVLNDGDVFVERAQRAARFVRARLWDERRGVLLRRFRAGQAGVDGYAEDYAYLVWGLLELFQADGDPEWLEWAVALQRIQDARFWDASGGGWFSTSGADPSVLLRLREEYDGAEPAASSVGAINLLTLSHLMPEASFPDKVERALASCGGAAARMGRSIPMMLAAASTYHAGMLQIVLAGAAGADELRAMKDALRRRYLPTAVVVPLLPEHRARMEALLPWTRDMQPRDGKATAYVCRGFACQAPVTSADALGAQLDELAAARAGMRRHGHSG